MRFLLVTLVLAGCGRLQFDADETELAITSPVENAQVGATATIGGTCKTVVPLDVSGDIAPATATCDGGAFSFEVVFSDGDGPKTVAVAQGAETAVRSFQRITPGLRAGSGATQGSAGFMIDCSLTIAAPSGLAARDLILGLIYTDGGADGAIGISGFTRLALSNPSSVAFYKFATENEPASYAFTVKSGTGTADTCESAGVLAAFKGVQLAEPILAQSSKVDVNPSLLAPGVNAPESGLLVVAYGSNGPSEGITMPADLVNAQAVRSPDGFANAAIGYREIGEGPTGDRTATIPIARGIAAAQIVLDVTP